MESKAMRRAVRSARAVLHGVRILEFIRDPRTRQKLIAAAETGTPPTTAISSRLAELVGARDVKLQPVKQFAGVCVRAVLEEEGFQVAAKGVRVSNDPVFRTGSTYGQNPGRDDRKGHVSHATGSMHDGRRSEGSAGIIEEARKGKQMTKSGRDVWIANGAPGQRLSTVWTCALANVGNGQGCRQMAAMPTKLGQGLVNSTGQRRLAPIRCATAATQSAASLRE